MLQSGMYKSEHQCPAPIICGCINWGKIYLGLSNGALVVHDIKVSYQYVIITREIALNLLKAHRVIVCTCNYDSDLCYQDCL